MLRRFVAFGFLTVALAACGGGDAGETPSPPPATAAPDAPSPASTQAPTQAPPTQPPSDAATAPDDSTAATFEGVEGLPAAQSGEYDVPQNFPADYPVPSGGRFELHDAQDDYVSFSLYYPQDTDMQTVLSFFEEGLPASGWEATEQHSNKDQFGYRNENRQFSKGDDGATVTVWFPEEDGNEPFVTIDYFRF